MDKVKIGIIGTGVGIRTYFKGFQTLENAEVYAIAGSSLARSKEFAEKYGIPVACGGYKELCDLDEIDLVCITAPNEFHKDMLKYAVSKRKNIICEKPMVDCVEDANEMISVTNGYDKLLIIDHQLRFNPYISEIKSLIDSNVLGKIYNVKLSQQGTGFADPNSLWSWSFDGNKGGGVRLAMASHFTDLVDYWFDSRPVVSVFASMNPITKERIGLDGNIKQVFASTTCDALIRLENELTVQYSINAGSYVGSRFDISVFGDKGEITFSLQDKLKLYQRSNVGISHTVLLDEVYKDELENKVSIFSGSFRYLAPKVIESILTGDVSKLNKAATPKNSIYCLKVLNAIQVSSNTCESVFIGNRKEINSYV